MRWTSKFVALAAMLMVSSVAVMAQAKECTDDFKTATYKKWYDNAKSNQDVAYEATVEYFNVCASAPEDVYSKAMKKFKDEYEKLKNTQTTAAQFQAAVEKNNYVEQVRLGKQIVAGSPDNTLVYIYMASAGLKDAALMADSLQAAKKAIELIEGGKPFTPAYKNSKDLALASLTYIIAKATVKTSPIDAIPYFIKAAKYESDMKKNAQLYNELAAAHGERVAKLTADYEPHIGKPETPESKLILANLNQAIDLQIDALARATALADAANKPALMERLTELYKFRNKSETGLNELVAGVLSKPLPDVPTPITSLPTATPPAGTGSGSGSAAGSMAPPASAAPASPGPAKPSTTAASSGTAGQPSTATKPTASPTPKPKPRRSNHRRH